MICIENAHLGHHDKPSGDRTGLNLDVLKSPKVATHIGKIIGYLKLHVGATFRNADASGWDLGQEWRPKLQVLRTLCELYAVPEEIAVLIIIYSVFSGYISGVDEDYLIVQPLLGITKSGIGSFTYENHTLRGAYNAYVTDKLTGIADTGIDYGDDTSIATDADKEEISSLLLKSFNVHEKIGQQLHTKEGISICRKTILANNLDVVYPVVYSIFRNAICPVDLNPYEIHWADLAIMRRASSLNLMDVAKKNKAWRQLRSLWFRYVCPIETLKLKDYPSDKEITAQAPRWSRHKNDLDYTRRYLIQ
jgi:hypothetical protein